MNDDLLTFYRNVSRRFPGKSTYPTEEIIKIITEEYERMCGLGPKQLLNE